MSFILIFVWANRLTCFIFHRDHSRPVERVEFANAVGFGRAAVTAGWDGFVFLYLCDENAVRGTGWRLARRFKGCEGAWVVSLAASPARRRRRRSRRQGVRVDVRVVQPGEDAATGPHR